ncbi:MAG: hypothetical protein OQJ97_05415 [Rhodospirillales bacterium]|nr:hypothetical protein [Rhodospirillales bacterium]
MSFKNKYLTGGLLAVMSFGGQTASAAEALPNNFFIDRIVNSITSNPVESALSHDLLKDFTVNYNNTLSTALHRSSGDHGTRLYSTTGTETYNDFSLSIARQYDNFRSMSAMISGTLSASDYRYDDRGFVPERINLKFENGAAHTPFKAEAGDTFADFSIRTVQTSVKGAQIEFQPQSKNQKEFSSIQLFTGTAKTDWSKGNPKQDYYTGASYLVEMPDVGLFSINWVNNIKEQLSTTTTESKTQNVYSIAGEKEFTIPVANLEVIRDIMPDQNIIAEGELSYFTGDHSETGVDGTDKEQNGKGYFFQLSGTNASPFSWRTRYERYSKDFAPAGAGIATGTQNIELHGAWRHESGLQTRIRRLLYTTNVDNSNPTFSKTWGVNFSGPFNTDYFPHRKITGTADFFQERSETDYKDAVSVTRVADINLAAPMDYGWNGRAGLVIKSIVDVTTATGSSLTKEVSVGGDHALTYNNWKGTITPTYRLTQTKTNSTNTFGNNPTLSINMLNGQHSAGMVASLTKNVVDNGNNYDEYSFDANYGYNLGAHTFRFEGNALKRETKSAGSNRDLRIGVSWNYNYDKPAGSTLADKGLGVVSPATVAESDTLDVKSLAPGLSLKDTLGRLDRLNIKDGAEQPGERVFETRLIEEVPTRQRLVVQHSANTVNKTGAVIAFDNIANVAGTQRTFKQVRSALFAKYGQPSNVVEKGNFSATLATDIRNGEFVRIYEWKTPSGVIRFGIPKRLDNTVRMEVQHARSLPPTANSSWSMETVR